MLEDKKGSAAILGAVLGVVVAAIAMIIGLYVFASVNVSMPSLAGSSVGEVLNFSNGQAQVQHYPILPGTYKVYNDTLVFEEGVDYSIDLQNGIVSLLTGTRIDPVNYTYYIDYKYETPGYRTQQIVSTNTYQAMLLTSIGIIVLGAAFIISILIRAFGGR